MKVKLDVTQVAAAYSAAFRKMAALTGFDHRDILRAEAGSILKQWAGLTKVGNTKDALERARYRANKHVFGNLSGGASKNPYRISVNSGARGGIPGRVWYFTRNNKIQKFSAGTVYNAGNYVPTWVHYRAADWMGIRDGATRIGAELAKLLPLAPRSVGLAQQSVAQIADAIGIDLNQVKGKGISSSGIAKARNAMASTGKRYVNGAGVWGGNEVKIYVDLINRIPYGVRSGMDQGLAQAISGRQKFFETSYKKGAFESLAKIGKSYPNLIKVIA